ncbi:MAG: insulinase family protein [Filimonas sp.]|nr:insulinase family protein [Filimonas sp.]
MKVYQHIIILFALHLLAGIASAQSLKADAKLTTGKLPNGFTYYIYKNANPEKQAVLRLLVRAGSLQEEEDQRGLAHFVEHMAFNGTKEYKKNEVIEFLESKGVKFGADLNAHTSFDETVYKISIDIRDPKNLDTAIGIMSSFASSVTFDSTEVEKERGVIIEEWRSKQGAASRMRDQYMPLLFNGSRYAERMPIGKTEIIQHTPAKRIKDFYEKWYRPELMGIVIVTDVDAAIVEKYIRSHFAALKNKSKAERIYYTLPAHKDSLFSIVTDKEATAIDLTFLQKRTAFKDINTVEAFKENMQRAFFNSLCKERFARISQLKSNFRDAGMSAGDLTLKNAMVSSSVTVYRNQVDDGIKSFLAERERIFRYGFTTPEIDRLKQEYIEAYKRIVDAADKTTSDAIANELTNMFYNGNTLITKADKFALIRQVLPAIDSVTLCAYAQSMHTAGNTVVLLTAPAKESASLPSKEKLQQLIGAATNTNVLPWSDVRIKPKRLLDQQPVAGKIIREVAIDSIGVYKWQLSNGTTVYLKQTEDVKDNIQLSGFRQGGIYALDSTLYLSALFAKTIISASGAGPYSRRELSDYLTGNSATAIFALANSREGVVANAQLKDIQTMFELMYLKWTQPRFDTTVFNQVKKQALESAATAQNSPTYNYNQLINKLINEDNYMIGVSSPDRIEKELRPELILPAFNERFKSADNFAFVILCSCKPDSIRNLVSTYIGGLPAESFNNTYKYTGPEDQLKNDSITVYAGEAPKSTVNLFYQSRAIQYSYPVILQQQMLEEVLKVKLRMNLREKNSGVYGVSVSISSTSKPSQLIRSRISFTCTPEVTDFLVAQAKEEVKRIAEDPAYFKDELVRIRTQLIDENNKLYKKNAYWSAALRNHFYYGLSGFQYITDYEKQVNAVTAEMIAAFAKKYLIEASTVKAVLMPEKNKSQN